MRPRRCSGSASTTNTSSGSSSRCHWTPSTAGGGQTWSPPRRSWPSCRQSSRSPPPIQPAGDSAPAEIFVVDGGPGRVGVIGSVTRPFCGACDRVRLTADGQIRNCLFAHGESDLRTPLRAGADDDQLAAIWRRAVAAKLPGHGINDPGFLQPARPMSAIGGLPRLSSRGTSRWWSWTGGMPAWRQQLRACLTHHRYRRPAPPARCLLLPFCKRRTVRVACKGQMWLVAQRWPHGRDREGGAASNAAAAVLGATACAAAVSQGPQHSRH